MAKLTDIEGVGEGPAQKLKAAGIRSADVLIKKGATKKNREEIAERSGIGYAVILKWVNHADLFRVKGVGGEFAELLEAAGVDTVPALARRNPANLQKKMAEVNEAKSLVRRAPSLKEVTGWVEQAKALPRVISR